MDERDRTIIRAVVGAYKRHGGATLEDVNDVGGYSRTNGATSVRLQSLEDTGWLVANHKWPRIARTIRPGPRFGGLGSDGRIYENVAWKAEGLDWLRRHDISR